MQPTLHTLTGNLLWERTLDYATWSPGHTQRARASSFQVGGKGINVSRMLLRLNAPTKALFFAGGSTGADCIAWLQQKGIPLQAIPTSGATRIGAVIRAPDQPETTFFSPDVPPDPEAWLACATFIDQLPSGSVLALCGSFPGWTSPASLPLQEALARLARRGTLVADTYGPPLAWAVTQPLALIKINRQEFDALAPGKKNEPIDMRLSSMASTSPVHSWIVSDGENPVWLAERGTNPQSFQPPVITPVSPTGSGDVLLACLLHARHHLHQPMASALVTALPYAAANAAHPDIANFDLNNLPRQRSLLTPTP